MKDRITAILSTLALASFGLTGFGLVAQAAHAEGNESERCRDAVLQGDAEKVVEECTRALEADPRDERARVALDDAKAELARADGTEDPAKLNQH